MQKACVASSKRHSYTKCAACQAILRCHNYCSNDTSHIDTSFLASFYYRQQLLMSDRFPITGWLIENWLYLVIMASVRHNRSRSTNLNVVLSLPMLLHVLRNTFRDVFWNFSNLSSGVVGGFDVVCFLSIVIFWLWITTGDPGLDFQSAEAADDDDDIFNAWSHRDWFYLELDIIILSFSFDDDQCDQILE